MYIEEPAPLPELEINYEMRCPYGAAKTWDIAGWYVWWQKWKSKYQYNPAMFQDYINGVGLCVMFGTDYDTEGRDWYTVQGPSLAYSPSIPRPVDRIKTDVWGESKKCGTLHTLASPVHNRSGSYSIVTPHLPLQDQNCKSWMHIGHRYFFPLMGRYRFSSGLIRNAYVSHPDIYCCVYRILETPLGYFLQTSVIKHFSFFDYIPIDHRDIHHVTLPEPYLFFTHTLGQARGRPGETRFWPAYDPNPYGLEYY